MANHGPYFLNSGGDLPRRYFFVRGHAAPIPTIVSPWFLLPGEAY
jgi:hypothetical protein